MKIIKWTFWSKACFFFKFSFDWNRKFIFRSIFVYLQMSKKKENSLKTILISNNRDCCNALRASVVSFLMFKFFTIRKIKILLKASEEAYKSSMTMGFFFDEKMFAFYCARYGNYIKIFFSIFICRSTFN